MSDVFTGASAPDLAEERRPRRVRHEVRFRLLEVLHTVQLASHMVRVTLGGSDIEGFNSPGFDDHVKVFFPEPGEIAPPLPVMGEKGLTFPDDRPRPAMRDFTPRRHDPVAGVLELDFALHESGPASDWARQAAPGQKLVIGGPRGSFLLPMNFDWHLLIGDETALPAIARRLEELPAGAPVIVVAEVEGEAGQIAFETRANAAIHWAHRSASAPGAEPLVAALKDISFPQGDFHSWIACESSTAKRLRQILIENHGANPKWIRASGYWRRGAEGVHENFDDKDSV
ncbi:siderophore-interacting protein [Aerobium aerolatum]|uniref:NADPH-dependent ferric siderophore reductase, contains FAD-binding and SIP domains n=1 Tax=Aquamicrobium aerolatum DSM 21857 TaxID=1121003 RepID=A0A1I3SYJ4_9HYPH|nr:siderophore-interacting protein [Aquamicrobium aerolatum]SFJ63785.1 NADPH-dependent ferric siderophore reductase, contains FAD-binding and SIP domains [Aquamicrobium aerolatum DSM 21857]